MYDSIIEKLNSQIDNKKTVHAYLFEINNYDEDYKVVLNFVKMLLSNMNYNDVVNSNTHYFKQIDNEEYVDLYVVEPESNGIKKNQMINLMEEFNNKSLLDNKKIYIIKECEKFNSHSANTILKFLEEPNDDIIGILLTNNRYKVIDTIISRCQIIRLSNHNNLTIDEENDELALKFIDNIELFGKKSILETEKIFSDIISTKNREKLQLLIDKIIDMYYNIMKILINEERNKEILYYDKLFKYADYNDVDKILNKINCLIECKDSIKYNVNINLLIDKLIFSVGG